MPTLYDVLPSFTLTINLHDLMSEDDDDDVSFHSPAAPKVESI